MMAADTAHLALMVAKRVTLGARRKGDKKFLLDPVVEVVENLVLEDTRGVLTVVF